jgi:hypothetical protein
MFDVSAEDTIQLANVYGPKVELTIAIVKARMSAKRFVAA